MANHQHSTKKGNGCLGFGVSLGIAAVAIFCILLFATNVFDGMKYKIYGLFYPQKYTAEVEDSCEEFRVDKALIYAVIRTESGFRTDAESSAGAIGLMQLMPDTFTWLQEQLDGKVTYTESDLKTPAVNIRYGVFYLSRLLQQYEDTSTAVAAYNAGTSNVDEWLADPAYSTDGKTLSDIPYQETKKHVDKVNSTWKIYTKILDQNHD